MLPGPTHAGPRDPDARFGLKRVIHLPDNVIEGIPPVLYHDLVIVAAKSAERICFQAHVRHDRAQLAWVSPPLLPALSRACLRL